MILTEERPMYSVGNLSQYGMYTTILMWNSPESSPILRDERRGTNHMSHGMVFHPGIHPSKV